MNPTLLPQLEIARRQRAALAVLPDQGGRRYRLLEDGTWECQLDLGRDHAAPWESAVAALDAHGEIFSQLTLRRTGRGGTADLKAILGSERLSRFRRMSYYGDSLSEPLLRVLGKNPAAARLLALELGPSCEAVTDARAQLIAKSPHLSGLRELTVQRAPMGAQGITALLRALPLERLALSPEELTPEQLGEALHALTHTRGAGTLRELDLSWRVDWAGMTAFVSGERFAGLERLNLSTTTLAAATSSVLAEALGRSALKRLRFHHNGDVRGHGACAPLFAHPALGRLRELDLGSSAIGADELTILAENPALGGLESLDLSCQRPPEEHGWDALAVARSLQPRSLNLHNAKAAEGHLGAFLAGQLASRLERLNAGYLDIGGGLAEAQKGWGRAKALRRLDLFSCGLNDATLRTWLAAVGDTPIEHLRLGLCGITTAGFAALLESPMMRSLRHLDLDRNAIDDQGARLLAKSPALGHLRFLYLGGNALTSAGIRALAESPHLPEGLYLWPGWVADPAENASWRAAFDARGVAVEL